MVLITCPDCHQSVSHHAAACPNCGRPLQAPSWAPPSAVQRFQAERQNLNLAYGLYAGSFLVGLLAIASVILCYMRRREVRGTAAAAHYDWLIETFWTHFLGVLGGAAVVAVLVVIEGLNLAILVVLALMIFAIVYPIYRLAKGFMALSSGRGPHEGGRAVW
jgi:uncharacterized membrane protein